MGIIFLAKFLPKQQNTEPWIYLKKRYLTQKSIPSNWKHLKTCVLTNVSDSFELTSTSLIFFSAPTRSSGHQQQTMSREILCYPSVLIGVQIWTPGWQSRSPELAKILISLVYYAITSLFCGFCRTFTGIYVSGFFGETGTLSWLFSKAWIEPPFFLLSFTPVFLQMLPLRLW